MVSEYAGFVADLAHQTPAVGQNRGRFAAIPMTDERTNLTSRVICLAAVEKCFDVVREQLGVLV
jgi:hypothetical protein